MSDERTERIATEIMGWRARIYRNGVAVWDKETGNHVINDDDEYWNPRTRWDHAGMLLDKLVERAIVVELTHYEETGWDCEIYPRDGSCYTNEPDDDDMCAPTGPAAIFEAAYATLEEI